METSLFFEQTNAEKLGFATNAEKSRIVDQITFLDSEETDELLRQTDVAIIGVNEDRHAVDNQGCAGAPDIIRKHLYRLFTMNEHIKMVDLGNIRMGEKVNDTYFALRSVIAELLKSDVIPVVLGGSHDLTYPIYLAYESVKRIINLVNIDAMIDHGTHWELPDSHSFLSKIIMQKPNYLFNFTNIGHQSYFVDKDDVKLLGNLYFDVHRLGEVRTDLTETEPMIRNADLLTVDISAIRQCDAPANANASPNGFYGEEVCQMMRYAGLANRLSCLGFFEINPVFDQNDQTAKLIAQMIWYFLEGFALRQEDYPTEGNENFVKYYVGLSAHENDLVFFKSKKTDRWWMQLPVSKEKERTLSRHVMIPCSYKDYIQANNQEIPDRWWRAYQKLM
jgi:formiminoglutamase